MDMFEREQGIDFKNPADAREWLDNHPGLSDREKRRVTAWIDQWETRLGQQYVDYLNRLADSIEGEAVRAREAIDEERRRLVEVNHGLRNGRMSREEGEREITRSAARHQEFLRVLQSVEQMRARWTREVEGSPVDRLTTMQERFASGFPGMGAERLTLTIIRGEE